MNYLSWLFNRVQNKNRKGTINELFISGNMFLNGYETTVLDDWNPSYDILATKADKTYYLESKLDNVSHITGNFYFEYWNYTYSRKTGINNDDLETLYSHTYFNKEENKYYFLIGKRKHYIQAIKSILTEQPNKMRKYNNTYYSLSGIKGDAAYIVNKETFLSYFKGYKRELIPQLTDDGYNYFIKLFFADTLESSI